MKDNRPKRAIIAYCVLAQRLQNRDVSRMQALTPFLSEACVQFSGELFNAEKFSQAVEDRYGLKIPRLAVLGLAEQLAAEGMLINISDGSKNPIYKFSEINIDNSASVTEQQVESLLVDFVNFCRQELVSDDVSDDYLHEALFSRLLNIDSLKILTRKEIGATVKRSAETILLRKPIEPKDQNDRLSYHLDFLVSQFLIDLRDNDFTRFEKVSDVAFANMAAEALACFSDPLEDSKDLSTLTVYLDTPLLLDMLGVNSEYSNYGTELLESIKLSGAIPAVFEHCINEAETAIQTHLSYLRSGINKQNDRYSYSAKPDLLNALSGNVADRVYKRLNILVQKDPDIQLHKRNQKTFGDIEAEMQSRMARWGTDEAISHDRKSILTLITISDSNKPSSKICDCKWIFLTRNTPLVSIANDVWKMWLKGCNNNLPSASIDRVAPISMSDKQFSGYLWARTGNGNGKVSKARLLACCSSAIRPRADIKARAYNLILELYGKPEAEDIAALLEDREGVKAIMRVTKGDPEDITSERLPLIIEKVKLAAGEFAANKVRDEKDKELQSTITAHSDEIKNITKELSGLKAEGIENELKIQQLVSRNSNLLNEIEQRANSEQLRKVNVERIAHNKAHSLYSVLKFGFAVLLPLIAYLIADYKTENGILKIVFTLLALSISVISSWHIPDKTIGPTLNKIACWYYKRLLQIIEPSLVEGAQHKDFSKKSN